MRVSVVMTTYNGEKYIEEMLNSIKLQSRQVDEVIIVDDVSTDRTVQLVKKFIEKNDLNQWKLIVNAENVGWKQNFKKALAMATGDLIFLADQDDVWRYNKVEKMIQKFVDNEKIWLLVSQVNIFTQDATPCSDMDCINTDFEGKVLFNYDYYVVKRPGCSMAMRKEILPLFFDIWNSAMPHDAALWAIANLIGKLYLIDEKLINYRRHNDNVTNRLSHNVKQSLNSSERTKIINNWYLNSEYVDLNKTGIVQYCDKWCDYRIKLIKEKKIIYFFKLYKYRKCYTHIKRWFGDLYYFCKKIK